MSTKSDYRVTKDCHLTWRRVTAGDIVSLTAAQAKYAHVTPYVAPPPSKSTRRNAEAEISK